MNEDLDKFAQQVVVDLKTMMYKNHINPRVYVGKTNDFVESLERHKKEGFPILLQITTGTPGQIAKLESLLSDLLRKDPSIRCDNKNGGSAGSVNADKLYICIDESYDGDLLYDADQDILLDKKYPMEIDD
ncbi:MAG: hypothetical protein K2K25_13160 [Muribaculaceae bacterium]|nr:hypothetical protein [Muribaculaceae bacterium]